MNLNVREIFSESFRNPDHTYSDTFTSKEIDLLFTHKLFKLFLPEETGGLHLSMQDVLQVIEDTSYVNGSLGWLIQIGNGGMYFASNFEKDQSLELFSKPDALIAGSGTPGGRAKQIDGGYRITGSWRYCSGADFATYFTVTFITESGEILSAILPREKITVVPDWKTTGLRNTSSHTISANDVFVEHTSTFSVLKQKAYFEEKVFSLPFVIYAQAFFIHVVYGTFARLTEEAEILATSKNSWSHDRKKEIYALCESGKSLLNEARNDTSKIIATICSDAYVSGNDSEIQFQQTFIVHSKKIRAHAFQIFEICGIDMLYRENTATIFYHDLIAASQHKLLLGTL